MLDLLAAIQSVDPPSLVLWGLALFAAGMYPVGFMLGATCSPCCGSPCSTCAEGELPDTITVTFDGLQDKSPGPDLITLSFSACFGGGASGKVTAPGGDPDTDKGPISAVSLTSGGGGYAKLGRVAPTLTVSGGSGTGATFTPTLTSTNDACGIPSWSIASVSVKGGTGYVDGETLTVTVAEGDTEAAGATLVVNTTRTQPTVTASASGGSGAAFSVTLTENAGPPKTWSASALSITNGGTGYPSSGYLTFSVAPGDTETESASAFYTCGRSQPTVSVQAGGSGSGATLTATLTEGFDWWSGLSYWYVSSISVTDGGTGYTVGDPVSLTVTDGEASWWASFDAVVAEIDEDGVILAVQVNSGGEYFKNTGVISSVSLYYGGSYYRDDGIPTGVTVSTGGQYYREDEDEQPYVATVTVSVASQVAPSNGSGAVMTATVDSSVGSATFGQVTGVTITSGGSGYLAWEWRNTKCCGDYYNGLAVVLKRSGCVYEHRFCGVGNMNGLPGLARLSYSGPNSPPGLVLFSESGNSSSNILNSSICNTSFTANKNVADCSDWSGVTFAATGGATATVTAGGEYDATFRNPGGGSCFVCCKGEEELSPSIGTELVLADNAGTGYGGTYITNMANPPGEYEFRLGNFRLFVRLATCSFQSSGGFSPVTIAFDQNGNEVVCDECHNKCGYQAFFSTQSGGGGGFRRWYSSCDEFCEETPICKPSKTITLCHYISGPPNCPYTVTIQ